MSLFGRVEPRKFSYIPQHHQPGGKEGIKFRRATLYDPHERSGSNRMYIALAIVVALLIIIIGGIRKPARPPELTKDDAVVHKKDEVDLNIKTSLGFYTLIFQWEC